MATITLTGNLAGDPEFKTTSEGNEYAKFSIAWSERQKSGDDWIDGPVTFVRCTVWGRMASHVVANLRKGNRVIASGEIRAEEWASDKGPQTDVVMTVKQIGVSIEFHDVTITKRERSGGAGAFGQGTTTAQQPQAGQQPSGWGVQDAQHGFTGSMQQQQPQAGQQQNPPF